MRARGEDDGAAAVCVRPHWIQFSGAASFATFVALVGALLIRHNDLPRATDGRILAWCTLIAALGFVGPVVRWSRTRIEVADGVARCSLGVVRRWEIAVDLGRARRVEIEQSLLGRLLGYGNLHVVDAQGGEHRFPPIRTSDALSKALGTSARRASSRSG